ncbi:MAG: FtsX-like permease family protein [Candidatus Kapaibacterium sp.]|nr:MAG: FtsX-like permease family protein [Candidatus Kapabacteria bacterium]
MFANYLKLAFRALWRRKFTTGLNVLGLALGMTAFLFLMEFASFHAGFDAFHPNANRLFRFVGTSRMGGIGNVSPAMLALRDRFPSIEAIPTFMTSAGGVVQYKPQSAVEGAQTLAFQEGDVAYGNNDIFRAFSFPFLAGSPDLDKPNTMVITASAAQKYFACNGNYQSAIGKRLLVANQFTPNEFTVTGVMQDIPENSHLKGNMLFSLQTLANPANLNNNSWASLDPQNTSGFLTAYILLKEGAKAAEMEAQMAELSKKMGDLDVTWHLQPIRSIHTGDGFNDPLPNAAALKHVVIASSIAFFVLALAWINYINLSTAFGLSRAREIGVRKAIGASRQHLVLPYLLECALLTFAALLIALTAVELLQKPLNTLLGAKLNLGYALSFGIGSWGIVALVLGAMLSGGYVALVLTGVDPIVVLRGNFARSARGGRIRSTLVVVQFAVSIVFIAGTVIVWQQLNFMRGRDLGMNLEQLLVIDGPQIVEKTSDGKKDMRPALVFKQELARLPFVQKVAGSQNIPGEGYNFSTEGITSTAGQKGDEKKRYNMLIADENYFATYEMKFVSGKGYQNTDNNGDFKLRNVVVNESAMQQLGFRTASEAVGQCIQWGDDTKGQRIQICGVVKNYHHKSLHGAIEPIIFCPSDATSCFTLRMTTNNVQANMATLEQLYKRILPGNPFIARFADEIFQKQYEDDSRGGNLFAIFSSIAIVIACLGLFGLAAFAAESRTKEIGVRKVLGASEASIVALLSKDFLKLVAIAFVIGAPLAFWLMSVWLQDFAYHVELRSGFGVAVLAIAGIVSAGVAFMTVAGQAWKAARANAVKSLRHE